MSPVHPELRLTLADQQGLRWAQQQVTAHHYLHHPVDVRARPLAYVIVLADEPVGCLIFGRPESTRCTGWYGSVEDVQASRCPLTRWQILNLARVWLDPRVQMGGDWYIPNAASRMLAQALRRVGYDYLMHWPVVWMDEPYEIREVLSYCDTSKHRGTLYRACNFVLRRVNARGIETYVRPLRRLTHAERAEIARASRACPRARRKRLARAVLWPPLFGEEAG